MGKPTSWSRTNPALEGLRTTETAGVPGRGSESSALGGFVPAMTGGPTSRILQIWRPEEKPIPASIELNLYAQWASPGAGTITPAGLTFQLPANCIGRIANWYLSLLNVTPTTIVNWTLLVNGVAAPGWNQYTMFPGNVPRLSQNPETFILLPQGATISVVFQNVDGAAYPLVGAAIYGWYHTVNAAQAWMGEAAQ